jgi:hypothetical protein
MGTNATEWKRRELNSRTFQKLLAWKTGGQPAPKAECAIRFKRDCACLDMPVKTSETW